MFRNRGSNSQKLKKPEFKVANQILSELESCAIVETFRPAEKIRTVTDKCNTIAISGKNNHTVTSLETVSGDISAIAASYCSMENASSGWLGGLGIAEKDPYYVTVKEVSKLSKTGTATTRA